MTIFDYYSCTRITGDEANAAIAAEDFPVEDLREDDIDKNLNRYEAAMARYMQEKMALLNSRWNVTKTYEAKDKKLRQDILVRVTNLSSPKYGTVGRLISAITTQRWKVLFRKDGVDVDEEVYIENDFRNGSTGTFFIYKTLCIFHDRNN